MTASATTPTAVPRAGNAGCDRPAAVTRSLLGYGPLAAVVYLGSGLAQAATRDGFDLSRHSLSLLSNGPLGWIHVTTLVLVGLMTVAAAVGLQRAPGSGGTWGPALVAGYGTSLVAAGIFVADPMDGFPLGTPAGPPAEITTSGVLHLAAGGVGFICLAVATVVFARRFAAESRHRWARGSVLAGVAVLGGFVGAASGSASSLPVLGLWIGVAAGWGWLAAVSVHFYRHTPHPTRRRD